MCGGGGGVGWKSEQAKAVEKTKKKRHHKLASSDFTFIASTNKLMPLI
jgi:Fe-S oxidoreductase